MMNDDPWDITDIPIHIKSSSKLYKRWTCIVIGIGSSIDVASLIHYGLIVLMYGNKHYVCIISFTVV